MSSLFEMLKGVFFFLTIVVGLFLLRGGVIFGAQYQIVIKQIMMPGYLVFCGCMFGYILARIQLGYDEDHPSKQKIYIRSFIIGIILGILLALAYIFI